MAVWLGRDGSKFELLFLACLGFGAPLVGMAFYDWSSWVLLSLGATIPLLGPARMIARYAPGDDPRTLIPPLGGTARAVGLYGLLLGLGLALGSG
jgi:1,4-dihydroxy-2-naphthoate octaprenyltransferase